MKSKAVGERVGRFVIREELGRGGMGVVWRCHDPELGRDVALKMLLDPSARGGQSHKRFLLEAEALARLRHPGIVAVHEVGEHLGALFIVSDLVEGMPVSSLLESGPLEPRQAAELMARVADAVDHAHGLGIIHRDLKPQNILVQDGLLPQLLDFGLALDLDAETRLSETGQILGTPKYLAPEQISNERGEIGPHTDIHALGVVLFELLVGKPPFEGPHAPALYLKIIRDEPPLLRGLDPSLPEDLEAVVSRCLEKRPEERYATAALVARDLRCHLAGEPLAAQTSTRRLRWRRLGKRRGRWALLGTLVLVAALSAWFAVGGGSPPGPTPPVVTPVATSSRAVAEASMPDQVALAPPGLQGAWWDPPEIQRDYARDHGLPLWCEGPLGLRMVLIPPGRFQMGSPPTEVGHSGGETLRGAMIRLAFYMAATEVTNAQMRQLSAGHYSTPFRSWSLNDADQPAVYVNWQEATLFCDWLTRQSGGVRFRLSDEAEWEWAARAGTTSTYYWGDDPAQASQFENIYDLKGHREIGYSDRHPDGGEDGHVVSAPVGSFAPNPWGLFDMSGNVAEWCQDPHTSAWTSADGAHVEPGEIPYRVVRGGSWRWTAIASRSAYRAQGSSPVRNGTTGIRVVADLAVARRR